MRLILLAILSAVLSGFLVQNVQAVSITERAGNPFRTAANNQEFTLNKQNVNPDKFGLLRTYDFDAKVETQPLIIEKGAGSDDLVI
ncbi:MAG: hypothetical protein Q7U30_04925, partial [Methylicorpusculum sp.]|nr:hypothetical protein [Methylicorpusculum sp.]